MATGSLLLVDPATVDVEDDDEEVGSPACCNRARPFDRILS